MGLFDEVNKAVTNQQEVNSYSAILQENGISINNMKTANLNGKLNISGTVHDMQTAERVVALLQGQPGIEGVVNLLEVEDLTSKNIQMSVETKESNLNIRKGPGTNFEIIGKASHGSTVQLIKRMYNDWYYVKTDEGIEGFCSKSYLKEM
ncbi:MAG TPA: SH3 domain-containing protein [Sphingobacteriaceae bacterium]|nr:SH3 domain-containing protein [Sphingobacteriaceae bacterium]